MGNELYDLLNNHLRVENPVLYHACSQNKVPLNIFNLLHRLNQFDGIIQSEGPDMYAKIENEVLILEHFEFDGSKVKKRCKGMTGFEEESIVEKKYQKFLNDTDNGELLATLNYSQNSQYYIENFLNTFKEHYHKIDRYKKNLSNQNIIDNNSNIITGFFIENKYPPVYIDKGTNPVVLLSCKQFLDIFEISESLDFVLFGGCISREFRLFYIDKHMLKDYRTNEINLSNIEFFHGTESSWASKILDTDGD
jgi:hypothetical protein